MRMDAITVGTAGMTILQVRGGTSTSAVTLAGTVRAITEGTAATTLALTRVGAPAAIGRQQE
jgi:hypothetical protein